MCTKQNWANITLTFMANERTSKHVVCDDINWDIRRGRERTLICFHLIIFLHSMSRIHVLISILAAYVRFHIHTELVILSQNSLIIVAINVIKNLDFEELENPPSSGPKNFEWSNDETKIAAEWTTSTMNGGRKPEPKIIWNKSSFCKISSTY